MRAVVFTGAGGNEVVEVVERADPVPGDDEVLIAAPYAGLNPADLHQRAGNYPPPPGTVLDIPGLEVAGTVVALGRAVTEWSMGDRVMGLVGGGGLADRVVANRRHVTRVPDMVDDSTAAAIPEAFLTAHDAVRTQAQLCMGETVLVQGANGGVGSAAVQIGVAAGARVIGVSRSAAGRAFIESLGAEAISGDNTRDSIAALTGGEGVDVVLELVGATNFPDDLFVLRDHGRIVVIGVGSGVDATLPLGVLIKKRASVRGSFLRYRNVEEKATAVRRFEREVLPHLARGTMAAQVDRVFPLSETRAAFDHLESATKLGKVLLDLR
ncbi:MAG: Quinone oxidoreductase [Cryobacterium sp.]|nr:Quinone oxidoreductase [Cryobacterium sp.]